MLLRLRNVEISDLDFLVQVDLVDEGITPTIEMQNSKKDKEQHRKKILKFLTDQDKGAFIYEDLKNNKQIGTIMYTISNRDKEYPWKTVFHEIDRRMFQEDGRFMEVFQLWVDPNYRRKGLATKLKQRIEKEAQKLKVNLIYTHTEESNKHVIELNKKLGYQEVRRGPIWDSVVRISLIKHI
jgi:ribosomal protein S18 acetylase RimI-like enzyme